MPHFILMMIFGLTATEVFSYFAHRYLFHGLLWRIHRTHHQARTGKYELNDVFSLFFAGVSMSLMMFAKRPLSILLRFRLVPASPFTEFYISSRTTFSRIAGFCRSNRTTSFFGRFAPRTSGIINQSTGAGASRSVYLCSITKSLAVKNKER